MKIDISLLPSLMQMLCNISYTTEKQCVLQDGWTDGPPPCYPWSQEHCPKARWIGYSDSCPQYTCEKNETMIDIITSSYHNSTATTVSMDISVNTTTTTTTTTTITTTSIANTNDRVIQNSTTSSKADHNRSVFTQNQTESEEEQLGKVARQVSEDESSVHHYSCKDPDMTCIGQWKKYDKCYEFDIKDDCDPPCHIENCEIKHLYDDYCFEFRCHPPLPQPGPDPYPPRPSPTTPPPTAEEPVWRKDILIIVGSILGLALVLSSIVWMYYKCNLANQLRRIMTRRDLLQRRRIEEGLLGRINFALEEIKKIDGLELHGDEDLFRLHDDIIRTNERVQELFERFKDIRKTKYTIQYENEIRLLQRGGHQQQSLENPVVQDPLGEDNNAPIIRQRDAEEEENHDEVEEEEEEAPDGSRRGGERGGNGDRGGRGGGGGRGGRGGRGGGHGEAEKPGGARQGTLEAEVHRHPERPSVITTALRGLSKRSSSQYTNFAFAR